MVLMLPRIHDRIRIYRFFLLVSRFIDISKNGFANVGRDVRLRDSVIRFSSANERDISPSPFPSSPISLWKLHYKIESAESP